MAKNMILCTIYSAGMKVIYTINGYTSIIREHALREPGKFELKTISTPEVISAALSGFFVKFSDDEKTWWLIESVNPDISNNDYNSCAISGRCLHALLGSRIVWGTQTVVGTQFNRIYWLIYYQAVHPEEFKTTAISDEYKPYRVITFLQDIQLDSDDKGTSIDSQQYTGDNLLEAVDDILGETEYGIRVEVSEEDKKITPYFFKGQDRTNTVKFESNLGLIGDASYLYDIAGSSNCALAAGEGEGDQRKFQLCYSHLRSGLWRRELFVDARDLQSENYSGTTYYVTLQNRGFSKLLENKPKTELSFDLIQNGQYEFGRDYSLGDMITVIPRGFGISATCRVIKMQVSDDSDGRNYTPTVEVLNLDTLEVE